MAPRMSRLLLAAFLLFAFLIFIHLPPGFKGTKQLGSSNGGSSDGLAASTSTGSPAISDASNGSLDRGPEQSVAQSTHIPMEKDAKTTSKDKDLVLDLLNDPIPRRNFSQFAHYPPQNAEHPSKYTYATLLCTREPDLRDPFFAATQSLIWRILWSPWHSVYPITIFVCPFIPQEQRSILQGQGAIVKEIDLVDGIVPLSGVSVPRWRDQFTKLNMWKEVNYKKIVYLDLDAFPVKNIDDVFDISPYQSCVLEKLDDASRTLMGQDTAVEEHFCRYTFAGVDHFGDGEINGGFMVFSPSSRMHNRLLENAKKTDQYDIRTMEQGFLHSQLAFGFDGPFPPQRLPQIYNAISSYYIAHRDRPGTTEEADIRVIHDKLWNDIVMRESPELTQLWALDWMAMCRFFDHEIYEDARITGKLKSPLEWYNLSKTKSG